MKRSLIILVILLSSFGFVSAENSINNNSCVKPEGILEENNNKEAIYEFLKIAPTPKVKGGYIDWSLPIEELIEYYMNCFTETQEEKQELIDLLLLYDYWLLLISFDKVNIHGGDTSLIINVGEKAINDLNKYGKDNENYDFYLGRYSFFIGIAYYNIGEYKKALDYLTTGFSKQVLDYKYPKNFSISNTSKYGPTIDIQIGNDIMHPYFYSKAFTNKYKDFGLGIKNGESSNWYKWEDSKIYCHGSLIY